MVGVWGGRFGTFAGGAWAPVGSIGPAVQKLLYRRGELVRLSPAYRWVRGGGPQDKALGAIRMFTVRGGGTLWERQDMKILAAVAALALPMAAQAQSISTATANNGSGGIFMHITPTGDPIELTSFATYFSGVVGSAVAVEVWTRPGDYTGFTSSNVGWTLTQTVMGTSAGSTVLSDPILFTTPILIPSGGPTSVYLHTVVGGGLRYTGTSGTPPQTTWMNADLTLFSDVARTGNVAFSGSQNSPRTFAGTLTYNVVPAPASLALLGLGGAVAVRRRRR